MAFTRLDLQNQNKAPRQAGGDPNAGANRAFRQSLSPSQMLSMMAAQHRTGTRQGNFQATPKPRSNALPTNWAIRVFRTKPYLRRTLMLCGSVLLTLVILGFAMVTGMNITEFGHAVLMEYGSWWKGPLIGINFFTLWQGKKILTDAWNGVMHNW